MAWYGFALASLAVWRVTHLLHAEDGPFAVVARLRRAVGHGQVGQALDCFYCLSVWIAAPAALAGGATWPERAVLWPALSAAAIAIERLTRRAADAPPLYYEHQEDDDVLLRQQASRGQPDGGGHADPGPLDQPGPA